MTNDARSVLESLEPLSRREWLSRAGMGAGVMGLLPLLKRDLSAATVANPLASKPSHFPASAKRIIWLFMHGGPSQVDTFDPKPALARYEGQPPPSSVRDLKTQFTDVSQQALMASRFSFQACGQSGIEISSGFKHLRQHADKLAVIRSCHHEIFNHTPGIWMLNTGHDRMGRPSMGSWLSYGLGCEADNLPAFVVMNDGALKPGPGVWGSGFLPSSFQGTQLNMSGGDAIPNLKVPSAFRSLDQREMLNFVQRLNRVHRQNRGIDSALDARIASYELAYRMQSAAPDAVDLSKEPSSIRQLYGGGFGEMCLTARRLVERGVRMVQIYNGCGGQGWDTHNNSHDKHVGLIHGIDQGCAALLADLKSRGMLDDTLVIWSGEFGRTPTTEGESGRDHSPYGFSMWMAGGGVKGGQVIGATDELGFRAVSDQLGVHDLHATLLKLMGIDHEALTWFHQGRDMRLTDVFGDHDIAARLTSG